MLFNSYIFLFAFLPVILLVISLCKLRGTRVAVAALLVGSLVFYGYWSLSLLPLVLLSIAFNFAVARGVSACRSRNRVEAASWLLFLGVAGDLAVLGYYKYAMLFLQTANELVGISLPVPTIILPIGISFFTFTQIAYLVDVSKGKADAYDPIEYALFISYFPHLIAGPIIHHREVIPQFRDPHKFAINTGNLSIGLTIFTVGLSKKLLLADNLADGANLAFDQAQAGGAVPMAYAWIGALSYSFQLYFDFSGYSDMAIGLSRMFGVALPINFNSPYKAENIIEFWRRWHMTLSRFLRDYLYIPLGGNRHGDGRRYLNLFLTMLLGGLWHGAGWAFALWGALHGAMLIINHLWMTIGGRRSPEAPRRRMPIARTVSILATFLCVTVAWIPFRAEGLSSTWILLRAMVGLEGMELPLGLARLIGTPVATHEIWGGSMRLVQMAALCAIAGAISWFCPNTQQIFRRYWLAPDGQPMGDGPSESWLPAFSFGRTQALAMGLLFTIMIFTIGRQTHFLYFQF